MVLYQTVSQRGDVATVITWCDCVDHYELQGACVNCKLGNGILCARVLRG